MSPLNGCTPLYLVGAVNGSRDGAMRQKHRHKLHFEVRLVPSQDGVPAGDGHPYRDMDEDEREALLVDSLARILRECAEAPLGKPPQDFPTNSP